MNAPARRLARFLAASLAALAVVAAPACGRGDAPAAVAQPHQEIPAAGLPREARETLDLIRRGGPFPHDRDGIEFRNFERLLPAQGRGYYREYTVRTPGVKHRGARRIVAGGCPAGAGTPPCAARELYYTEDHYKSFRRIRP